MKTIQQIKDEVPEGVYTLLSIEPIPCMYKNVFMTKGKWKRGRCWITLKLNGKIIPIVDIKGHGMGGAVVVMENNKTVAEGYFYAPEDVKISKDNWKKSIIKNNLHKIGFCIFQ